MADFSIDKFKDLKDTITFIGKVLNSDKFYRDPLGKWANQALSMLNQADQEADPEAADGQRGRAGQILGRLDKELKNFVENGMFLEESNRLQKALGAAGLPPPPGPPGPVPLDENKAIADPFEFDQKDDEVTVTIPVPPKTAAADVKVVSKRQHLQVSVKGHPLQPFVIDGKLAAVADADSFVWTLETFVQRNLVISFEKEVATQWVGLLDDGKEAKALEKQAGVNNFLGDALKGTAMQDLAPVQF